MSDKYYIWSPDEKRYILDESACPEKLYSFPDLEVFSIQVQYEEDGKQVIRFMLIDARCGAGMGTPCTSRAMAVGQAHNLLLKIGRGDKYYALQRWNAEVEDKISKQGISPRYEEEL